MYNAIAKTLCGKTIIDKDNNQKSGNNILFTCDGIEITFQMTASGEVDLAAIKLMDDAAAESFLFANASMIYLLGELDYEAFGSMLMQYGQIQRDNPLFIPGMIGLDEFNIIRASDDNKVCFLYMNKDLTDNR